MTSEIGTECQSSWTVGGTWRAWPCMLPTGPLSSEDVSQHPLCCRPGRGDNPRGDTIARRRFSGWFSLSDRDDLDGFVVLHQTG